MYTQIACATPGVRKGAASFHNVADDAYIFEACFDYQVATNVCNPGSIKLVARVPGQHNPVCEKKPLGFVGFHLHNPVGSVQIRRES